MCVASFILVNDNIDELCTLLENNHETQGKALPLKHFLRNIVKNNLPYDVYVDKWELFQIVIVTPRRFDARDLPVHNVCVYSTHPNLRDILQASDIFSHKDLIQVIGMNSKILPVFNECCKNMNRELKIENGTCLNPPKLQFVEIPPNETLRQDISEYLGDKYYASKLNPEKHSSIISDGSVEKSESSIAYYIKSGLSIGIFTKSEHELASWAITNTDLSLLTGNTTEPHRNQGLHKWCLLELAKLIDAEYDGKCCFLCYLSPDEHDFKIAKSLGNEVTLHPYDNVPCYMLPGNEDDVIESASEEDESGESIKTVKI